MKPSSAHSILSCLAGFGLFVVPAIGNAALLLEKTVDMPNPTPGVAVEFQVMLKNTGPGPVSNIAVVDRMPLGMEQPVGMMGYSSSQGTYDEQTGVWEVGTLNGLANATLSFHAIPSQEALPQCFVNEAVLADGSQSDIAAVFVGGASDCAHLETTVAASVIEALECTGGITSNSRLVFTVTVRNAGPGTAQGVTINLAGNYGDVGEPYVGGRSQSLGDIAAGESATGMLHWALPCGRGGTQAEYTVTTTTSTSTLTSTNSVTRVEDTLAVPGTGACVCLTAVEDVDGDFGGLETGCFIATAAYGSPLHPHVAKLRAFRDNVLARSRPGRGIIALYYRFSPPVADIIADHESLRFIVRAQLYPLVFIITYPRVALLLVLLIPLGIKKAAEKAGVDGA